METCALGVSGQTPPIAPQPLGTVGAGGMTLTDQERTCRSKSPVWRRRVTDGHLGAEQQDSVSHPAHRETATGAKADRSPCPPSPFPLAVVSPQSRVSPRAEGSRKERGTQRGAEAPQGAAPVAWARWSNEQYPVKTAQWRGGAGVNKAQVGEKRAGKGGS